MRSRNYLAQKPNEQLYEWTQSLKELGTALQRWKWRSAETNWLRRMPKRRVEWCNQRVRGEDPPEGGPAFVYAEGARGSPLLQQCPARKQCQLAGWNWFHEQPHQSRQPPERRAYSRDWLVRTSKRSHPIETGQEEPSAGAEGKERLQFALVDCKSSPQQITCPILNWSSQMQIIVRKRTNRQTDR